MPGDELITPRGTRVQVKALQGAPTNERSEVCVMTEPYDVLFAVRLNQDYVPLEAIEVPRPVLERSYPHGKTVSRSKGLTRDPDVPSISQSELQPGTGG